MPLNESLFLETLIGWKALDDTRYLNDINGVGEVVTQRTIGNLGYIGLAMAGEAGEVANVIKKMIRDGVSDDLKDKLAEEMVDVLIYYVIMLDITNINLYEAWTSKFQILNERFERASPKEWLISKLDRPL